MTPAAAASTPTAPTTPTISKKIVQIGCGVVGHAYARAFVDSGHQVLGIEASRQRMTQVQHEYRIRHVSEDLSDETGVHFILLSINTPLNNDTGALSMRYLWSSQRNVLALLRSNPNALLVIRSTVTLGFCAAYRSALARQLEHRTEPRLCFQPEFLRAKSALSDARSPWHVVLGADSPDSIRDYVDFQSTYVDQTRISFCSIDEAEVMKIFHNSFNAAKISYFNHAAQLIERVNARDGKQIDATATFKLISKTCEGLLNPMYGLTPGHAYYGSCLPKDSAELAHMEKSHGLECQLFSQVVEVNELIKRTDVEEVIHGDNHVDSLFFHKATATTTTMTTASETEDKLRRRNTKEISMVSLADADKLTDSSVDSS